MKAITAESKTGRFSARLYKAAGEIWQKSHEHPFLKELGEGSLSAERFVYYLKQDYVYLIDYAKMFAYGSVKATDLDTIAKMSALSYSTLNTEMELHRQYAAKFGVSREELEGTKPSPTTTAYTGYLLNVAAQGSLADVVSAVLPCMWSYREIGVKLAELPERLTHPLFGEWVAMYSSTEFGELTEWTIDLMDRLAEGLSEPERERLIGHFVTASKLEYMFWQMAYVQEEWPV
ncbi:thiaminase II [Paenibacillus sp. NPDC058071]|uniref:thiaminase II n=1 Tax=Paenibacillus sp. NPDC058071 TaxID=3346326 RepID=UPI0036D9E126